MTEILPSLGNVRTGCLCCPPKPEMAPMDWQPHPGFGMLKLTRDGTVPDGWYDFCSIIVSREQWDIDWLADGVTMGEIEEAAADDPDHDWRLEIHGPMGGVIYQRQGCAQWVAVERLDGFA